MLSKCVNPECDTPFRYLREGKVFRFETTVDKPHVVGKKPTKHLEHFWLCGRCAKVYTVAMEPKKGVRVVPLSASARRAAAS